MLQELLPFDVSDVFRHLPSDGHLRHKFRQFVLNPRVDGRARSVRDFARGIGFDVAECPLRKGMNGRLVRDAFAGNGYRIEINEALSVEAKRFAVMHEIAHYFRHEDHDDVFGPVKHFDLSGQEFYIDTKEEMQANEFAEAMFFGGGQLAAAHALLGNDIGQLSRYFGLTNKVIEIALRKLGRPQRVDPRK